MSRGRCFSILITFSLVGSLHVGCHPLGYSPFQSDTKGLPSYSHDHNLATIEKITRPDNSVSFGFFTDSHSYYKDLDHVVSKLNAAKGIDFVMGGGDYADFSIKREYKNFLDLMQFLGKPWLTAIGNHDAITNGKSLFKNLFGPYSYVFTVSGIRFIVWNNCKLEFHNKIPDWDWLQEELANSQSFRARIVIAHIPPSDTTVFSELEKERLQEIVGQFRVTAFLHGHLHNGGIGVAQGVPYLNPGSVQQTRYALVQVADSLISYDWCRGDKCERYLFPF